MHDVKAIEDDPSLAVGKPVTRSPLTGTKYVWLFSDERRPEYHADTFAMLQALSLKVGRAWAIKEALRTLWTYRQDAAVKRFFKQWYGWSPSPSGRGQPRRWHISRRASPLRCGRSRRDERGTTSNN